MQKKYLMLLCCVLKLKISNTEILVTINFLLKSTNFNTKRKMKIYNLNESFFINKIPKLSLRYYT